MILFFHKLKILYYLLSKIKYIVLRLFFFVIYLYLSGVIFMFLTYGPGHIIEFIPPNRTFTQLYLYLKWYYNNKSTIGYGVHFRMLIAFTGPYLLQKLFFKFNRNYTFKRIKLKIMRLLKGKSHSRESINVSKTDLESINFIKQLLVHDIEQVIDKRLNDIFFSKRKKD